MGAALPFALSEAGVLFGFLNHGVVNGFDRLVGVDTGRNVDGNLVPHPLAAGGEVEVLAGDGEVIDEGDAAACGMALVGPVAGFEERGAEEADLDDLAADAVDLDPVADADAVFAHEDKPAEEGEDEVLEDDGEACGTEAEDGGDLVGCAEDDEQNEAKGDELDGEGRDSAEGMEAAMVGGQALEQSTGRGGEQDPAEDQEGYPRERLKREVGDDAVLEFHLCEPFCVDGGELLLGLELVLDDVVHLREGVGLGHAGDFGFDGFGGRGRSAGLAWCGD